MRKHTANNLKKKPNKLWWAYPRNAKWKKFPQSLEMPQKILQPQEKSLNEIMLPKFSSQNQNRNLNLSPDMEIVKITTIVETIRQKRQTNAQISEAIKNIEKIIEKKRLKRSSHESVATTDSWHNREKKTFTSNKRARYPKSHYRDQQKESLPTRKRAVDLKVASNIAIPSTVFYKRIWEYINGTRPHSDIISDYSLLQNNSEKNNSTCTDKDRIMVSQSEKHKLQVISPNIKPERDFYKRIWDIINATQLTYGSTKARSKRNANIPKSNTSIQLCVQERKSDYTENKPQVINDKVTLDTAETIKSREIYDPYISDFRAFTNKTQWQPKTTIPIVKTKKLNNDLISSLHINTASASEVADLNKFPDNVETNVDYLASDNSTEYENNKSQKIITETRSPYSSQEQENSTISLSSPIEHTIDNIPEKEDQTKYIENYSINTTPIYDPLNIPYVEVPDYADQQEDNLDKGNQNSTIVKYKEYDSEYVDFERHYNPDEEFSSKSPNSEIKVLQNIQTGNNVPEILSNVNISHSGCIENKDSIDCIDKYDVKDTKLRNNNTEISDDVERSKEDSVESNERETSPTDFVDFDINEYRKPFNLDDFIKNDSIFKSIQTDHSKENTKYNGKKNPADRSEESEEFEIYATVPKEESYNYFGKNGDYDDGIIFDDRDEAKKNTHSSAKEKAEDSDVINEDHYHYDDKDFLRHIFGENNDKKSSESVETEDKFLSRYFTKDVLDQLRDNSTAEEERQKEESRNKEEIYKTLSKILDKKDRFSRLDENLDKMIEEGETIPIRYKNFWSLEYESPRKKDEASEETEI